MFGAPLVSFTPASKPDSRGAPMGCAFPSMTLYFGVDIDPTYTILDLHLKGVFGSDTMTSLVFWLSFLGVFLILTWLSEAVLSLTEVEVRRVRRPVVLHPGLKLTVPEPRGFDVDLEKAA